MTFQYPKQEHEMMSISSSKGVSFLFPWFIQFQIKIRTNLQKKMKHFFILCTCEASKIWVLSDLI
jgi:hypothetical protein